MNKFHIILHPNNVKYYEIIQLSIFMDVFKLFTNINLEQKMIGIIIGIFQDYRNIVCIFCIH